MKYIYQSIILMFPGTHPFWLDTFSTGKGRGYPENEQCKNGRHDHTRVSVENFHSGLSADDFSERTYSNQSMLRNAACVGDRARILSTSN